MKVEHKSLKVSAEIDKDFTQKQYEDYQEKLLEKSKEYRSGAAYNRIVIETAQETKILKVNEGDLAKPSVIKWLNLQVRAAMEDATTIPPE